MKGKTKVYFTCPTSMIVKKNHFYLELVKHIKVNSKMITYDWVKDALSNLKTNQKDILDYNKLKLEGINEADLVIGEISEKSIGVIHQITLALQKAKPVLLLSPYFKNNNTIKAIKSPWFIQKQYKTLNEAKSYITEFINIYSDHKKIRINLVISSFENSFLISEMHKHKKSKTEVIRDLIRREADKV